MLSLPTFDTHQAVGQRCIHDLSRQELSFKSRGVAVSFCDRNF
jgi:hypothetical protein